MKRPSRQVRKAFKKWRTPIRGAANPENQTNPLWQWCVRSKKTAYAVDKAFKGPGAFDGGPGWCFDRMGQPSVTLPGGRQIFIAGEHEDHYDPDFYIYNDVVVVDGADIEIFGYPIDVFPPTDFHTATLVGDDIVLIGNLGYPKDRKPDTTQVYRLSTKTWSMSRINASGDLPGWTHGHDARYLKDENAIVISGGKRCNERIVENINEYRLSLTDLTWFQLTDRQWLRWLFERVDGESNNLWNIRHAALHDAIGTANDGKDLFLQTLPEGMSDEMADIMSTATPTQIKQVRDLYRCPFTGNAAQDDEEEYNRFYLAVDGVVVRFDEEMHGITLTIEGDLPASVAHRIIDQVQGQLSAIEGAPYKVTELA